MLSVKYESQQSPIKPKKVVKGKKKGKTSTKKISNYSSEHNFASSYRTNQPR